MPLYGVRLFFSISSSTELTVLVQCDLATSAGHSLARLHEVTQRSVRISQSAHWPLQAPPDFILGGPVLHGMQRKAANISLLLLFLLLVKNRFQVYKRIAQDSCEAETLAACSEKGQRQRL